MSVIDNCSGSKQAKFGRLGRRCVHRAGSVVRSPTETIRSSQLGSSRRRRLQVEACVKGEKSWYVAKQLLARTGESQQHYSYVSPYGERSGVCHCPVGNALLSDPTGRSPTARFLLGRESLRWLGSGCRSWLMLC